MLGSSGSARLLCAADPRLSCWDAGQEAEGPAGCRGWMWTPQNWRRLQQLGSCTPNPELFPAGLVSGRGWDQNLPLVTASQGASPKEREKDQGEVLSPACQLIKGH